jgi:hypothetical protein
MIPKRMHEYLTNVLTKQTYKESLITQGSLRLMEFRFHDIDHLHRLGITVDSLGPYITPLTIYNLARGMTLKNAAATIPYGGRKA